MTETPRQREERLWREVAALRKKAADKWTEAGEKLDEAAGHHRDYVEAANEFHKAAQDFNDIGVKIIKKAEGDI